MGTNFYRKPILTRNRKNKLHLLIEEGKFTGYDVNDPECSVISMVTWLNEGVHICKRSSGWKIGFDHNWGKYYQPNRKSLEEFLSEPGYEIVDEYGTKYTPEQFWNEVDTWNSSKEDLWDSKAYVLWERSQNPNFYSYHCYEDKSKVKRLFGIDVLDPDSTDFEVDGLRFSVFSDFSLL